MASRNRGHYGRSRSRARAGVITAGRARGPREVARAKSGSLRALRRVMEADEFDPSTLVAVYSEEAYEDVPKTTRFEWQPFLQNPVAHSLRGFVDGLKKA